MNYLIFAFLTHKRKCFFINGIFKDLFLHSSSRKIIAHAIGITVGFVMIQHPRCARVCSSTEEKDHPYHKINLFSLKKKKKGNYISIHA